MAFREPAALRCARLGLHLHNLGVPTPRPRATVNCRVGPWTYRSYLVTDYIEGTSLYRYIRFGSQTDDELRNVAAQVARIWQQLVELGISHNDMKPENFIVDENLDVWLIDLEKTRESGKARRQQQREIFDVKNFLHIRGWRHRAEARRTFAEAFLRTPHSNWLRGTAVEQIASSTNPLEGEVDAGVSALILCDAGVRMPGVRQATDSVHDIADEIVLVEPTQEGRTNVLKRIEVCPPREASTMNRSSRYTALCPWVLVLNQNESVTPFLAKELQQKIADAKAKDAFRIPLEIQYFGRTISQPTSQPPIRLFRQAECSLSVAAGTISVSTKSDRVGRLTGAIQKCEYATVADFIEELNDESSVVARQRFCQGARAHMARGLWRAARRFALACARPGGIRSGWTGLQIAMLEGVFAWVQEAKLRQLANEFQISNSYYATTATAAADFLDVQGASPAPRAKAA
jgi:tRNA A-37 threonylcarbamoyl transferase component Bud32